ncbi:MAG: hypothetical protein MUC58_13855 [Rhizobiaceae bacterium]|jgi:hypothetical protein|nr:hypothetical protein [Rhizobiaceae bacterium]
MTTSLLPKLTLAAALAFGMVTFAKADETQKPKLDNTPTASITAVQPAGAAETCKPGNDALACAANRDIANRYPVNALEGMNLGW